MPESVAISRVTDLSRERLAVLLAESEAAGYRFVRRLVEEWDAGTNRFSRPVEALFTAESGGQIVGVCGLNVDPYLDDPWIGRVRNVYVLSSHRKRGVAGMLVAQAVDSARGHFGCLRLRGEEEGSARLYEALGFRPCARIPSCTHVMDLGG